MITRREFVIDATAVAVAVSLPARAGKSTEPQALLFDAGHAQACRRAESVDCARFAIVGDRVRFANQFFSAPGTPELVAGLTTYADYLVLTGCAAEHRYRIVSEKIEGTLVSWQLTASRKNPA